MRGLQGPLCLTPRGPGSVGHIASCTVGFAAGPAGRVVSPRPRELAAALVPPTPARPSARGALRPLSCNPPLGLAGCRASTQGLCFLPPALQGTPCSEHLCAPLASAAGDVGPPPCWGDAGDAPSGSRLVGQCSWAAGRFGVRARVWAWGQSGLWASKGDQAPTSQAHLPSVQGLRVLSHARQVAVLWCQVVSKGTCGDRGLVGSPPGAAAGGGGLRPLDTSGHLGEAGWALLGAVLTRAGPDEQPRFREGGSWACPLRLGLGPWLPSHLC